MLNNLHKEDWSEAIDASGQVVDIPEFIKDLAGPDQRTRTRALNMLYEFLYHQGGSMAITGRAIPYVAEMATKETTPDKKGILMLLCSIAGSPSSEEPFRAYYHAALQALEESLPKIKKLAEDSNEENVRKRAHELIEATKTQMRREAW